MFSVFRILYSFIFFINTIVILNEYRFLGKLGLPLQPEYRSNLSKTRQKIVDLIKAVRTVCSIPLIFLNVLGIVYEIFLG
ncbi:hypothetical protein VCUG_00238 [Vavraia culicis subsp. floridensis]|uniref:Yos1-like protein n=1 Tax=Vavraia culicis (isolate floridensis) TaxID=948595 RepID=L2GXV4_VAVCU|nr:uncharacterized protein VCUG_00238 [Vavraia culicis subsp. floridensis]ELA48197.1 hypothetical protein VCUG_00238 [Vavraia culicis subsp. floridensis]